MNAATATNYEWASEQPPPRGAAQDLEPDQPSATTLLVAGVVHDFNNLVHVIAANAALGRAAFDKGLSAHEYLDNILLATERADALAKQLRQIYARPSRARKLVDVAELVQQMLDLVRARLPEGAAIEARFDQDLPLVLADPVQLEQIVMNLCTNAFHALEAAITTRPKLLRIRVERAEAHCGSQRSFVCLSVRDNGIGMDSATRACIFQPFFTRGAHDGTGLGLSIVHGIVAAHGGSITVESAPGMGACFRVQLPVCGDRD